MNLEQKIKALLEASIVVGEESSGMSDAEIISACEREGLEDMIIRDEDGDLVNRDECVAALDTLELNQEESVEEEDEDLVTEAEEDEESDEELPAEDEVETGDEDLGDLEDVPMDDEESAEDEEEEEYPEEDDPKDVTVVVVSPELEDEEDEDFEEMIKDSEEEVELQKDSYNKMMENAGFSKEFQKKAAVVFEAVVNKRVQIKAKKLTEAFARKASKLEELYSRRLTEAKEQAADEMANIIDGYMTEATESWVEENAVALTENVRAEIAEEFIDGLKTLFKEHYVEVPEEKFDLVKAQEQQIDKLQESLDKAKQKQVKLMKEAAELRCKSVITEATKDLSVLEQSRFTELVESMDFKSAAEFEQKVTMLRETFDKRNAPARKKRPVMESTVHTEKQEGSTAIDKYVQAINKTFQ